MTTKKRILHWVGSSFAIVGVGFVALRLHDHWSSLDLSQISPLSWLVIAVLAMLYGMVSSLLFTLTWWNLLKSFDIHVTRLWAFHVYGVSQLAKYVPGNIFHLAGRQVMGMSVGAPSGKLLKSIIWELGLAATAGAMYGWLILPAILPEFSSLLSIILLVISVGVAVFLLSRLFGLLVSKAFGSLLLLQAISGGIFAILLDVVARDSQFSPQTWLLIGGSYIIAWLVGLVTPGAPAGAGVRELILLLLLKSIVKEADLLVAVVLGRIITVLGDVLFFMVAFLIPSKFYQKPVQENIHE
jgi:hypothetical protein